VQSLHHNHDWERGVEDALFRKSVSPCFQLAWRTLQNWFKGLPVLLFYSNLPELRDSFHRTNTNLIRIKLMLRAVNDFHRWIPGESLPQESPDDQCVYNLNWNNRSDEIVISFLLIKDHGLDLNTHCLCVFDAISNKIITLINLAKLEPKLVVNPNPYSMLQPPRYRDDEEDEVGVLQIDKCYEMEDGFLLDVGIQEGKFISCNGISLHIILLLFNNN